MDEFDQITEQKTKAYTADLVKGLSDMKLKPTLVIVGVGASIRDLIGEHPSIERNLVQIELKKLHDQEIKAVVVNGFQKLGITTEDSILSEVPPLANGFPHYAHLLGLSATKACLKNDTAVLTPQLFQIACEFAIQDAIERFKDAFSRCTIMAHAGRYPKILCACGHAAHDDRGIFRAMSVVEAYGHVFDEVVTIQSVVPALREFSLSKRGAVLTKVPYGNRNHYRFADPMMRPFLKIKARTMH